MIIILFVSAVISVILGEYIDAIVILIIVILNALLGFTQEYRAEKAMAALKRMSVPARARPPRRAPAGSDRPASWCPATCLSIEAGNAIPADARLVESANLRVQEAVLTGESEAVEKNTDPLDRGEPAAGRPASIWSIWAPSSPTGAARPW